jgi:hypothetical protein
MPIVKAFLRRAEEILEIAATGDKDSSDVAILIDHQGGMRMLDPKGWSLPALCAEFGAAAAYVVERRARTVRVEGWGGGERCLIQRELGPSRLLSFRNLLPGILQKRYGSCEISSTTAQGAGHQERDCR